MLVLATGNPSRGDDALGPLLAERLEDAALAGVEVLVDCLQNAFAASGGIVEVVASGAQNGAALAHDVVDVAIFERSAAVFVGETGPAVRDANEFVAIAQRHVTEAPDCGI